jgi:hypothetical protein
LRLRRGTRQKRRDSGIEAESRDEQNGSGPRVEVPGPRAGDFMLRLITRPGGRHRWASLNLHSRRAWRSLAPMGMATRVAGVSPYGATPPYQCGDGIMQSRGLAGTALFPDRPSDWASILSTQDAPDNGISREPLLAAVAAALPCRACDRRTHHGFRCAAGSMQLQRVTLLGVGHLSASQLRAICLGPLTWSPNQPSHAAQARTGARR